ncbi:hypothetical protein [Streptomyces sp. CA-111067]|uniref:hypothetical protein n=1 Tax=Streptomyces sp. CA-111067 TaxID=3240046 RepID=UPI003D9639E4
MGSSSLTLSVALVGVLGTLFAPVLSQRLLARAQEDLFEREQQASRGRWLQEQAEGRLTQRRESYVAVNAALRRYRVELMNYLWDVSRGLVPAEAVERLESARHTHHAAYAEAQMIASTEVLEELEAVVDGLSQGYRQTKNLEEGNPDTDGSFDEIRDHLSRLWDRLAQMRGVMRADLGVEDS